jgi:uncharacterized repeat protein (TIGR04138 family)
VSIQGEQKWLNIRARAAGFPEAAFQFVREGLSHTVLAVHGDGPGAPGCPVPASMDPSDESRHVGGQQLCLGLRELAIERYGLLAGAVLRKWGIRATDDFGAMVYAMIERGEMRKGRNDRFEDFEAVYDFDEAFGAVGLR